MICPAIILVRDFCVNVGIAKIISRMIEMIEIIHGRHADSFMKTFHEFVQTRALSDT